MDALLYPYRTFEIHTDTAEGRARAAVIAAILLYFDHVTLGGVAFPYDSGMPSLDEVRAKGEKLQARFGQKILQSGYSNQVADQLTCEEVAYLGYHQYLGGWARARRALTPLIKAGIVKELSLVQVVSQMRLEAEQRGDPAAAILAVPSLLAAFHLQEVANQVGATMGIPERRQEYEQSFTLANGVEPAAVYICKMPGASADFAGRGVPEHNQFLFAAYCVDMLAQSLISHALGLPLVSDDESHFAVRGRSALLSSLIGQGEHDTGDVVLKLFAQALLATLPGFLPRSLESILPIREYFADNLQHFRQVLQSLAQDLDYEKGDTIAAKDIQQKVRKSLAEPLEDLERQFSSPPRRLAEHLLTSAPVLTGGLAFMISLFSGGSPVGAVSAGTVGAFVAAGMKAWFEGEKILDNAKVAFLLRTKRYLEGQAQSVVLY